MRLIHFTKEGKPGWGAVIGDMVVDLGKRLPQYLDVRAVLEAHTLGGLHNVLQGAVGDFPLSAVALLPALPNPRRVFCAGVNYDEHRRETGRDRTENPVIFMRCAEAQVAHGQPMIKPVESDRFDFEGELAVVIGKAGRRIAPERAYEHIAAYSCYNDGSVRDWQRHTHQFAPGKNWDGTGGFGPWLVTVDEVPDATALTLITRLNGQVVQQSSTAMMIFDIPALIAYISTFTQLLPGDVIATGTPGGVGDKRTPPLYMRDGDMVEVEISGIGILQNPIQNERL